MAHPRQHANPSLEPSIVDILRQRIEKDKIGKEKIVFTHTERRLGAIEHPFFVDNVDNGLAGFGRNPELERLFDDEDEAVIPLYFDQHPTSRPVMSSNVRTHNILIRVTTPKRTGRRRRKGNGGPWEDAPHEKQRAESEHQKMPGKEERHGSFFSHTAPAFANNNNESDRDDDDYFAQVEKRAQKKRIYNQAQLPSPKKVMRILQDNIGKYKLESIGTITQSHRFRAMADFELSMDNSRFMNNFIEKVINGNIQTMREFRLDPNPPEQPDGDIIAPPQLSSVTLPFQYFYEQNPYVRMPAADESDEDIVDERRLVNIQASKLVKKSYFIRHDHVGVPQKPLVDIAEIQDPTLLKLVRQLQNFLEKRPVWTRRSLYNQLENDLPSWDLFKRAIQYVAYQFKSGPWHNAVIRWGIDPRTDSAYRQYQTVQFKLMRKGERPPKRRHRYIPEGNEEDGDSDSGDTDPAPNRGTKRYYHDGNPHSHMFDGREYSSSGRVWQVCDITDPLLQNMLINSPIRPTCNISTSGWYHAGVWRKVKSIMRIKMVAIRFKKTIHDDDFNQVIHEYPDKTPPPEQKMPYFLLPNLGLQEGELTELLGPSTWRTKLRALPGQKVIERDGRQTVIPERKIDIRLRQVETGPSNDILWQHIDESRQTEPLNQDNVLAGLSDEAITSDDGSSDPESEVKDKNQANGPNQSAMYGGLGFGFGFGVHTEAEDSEDNEFDNEEMYGDEEDDDDDDLDTLAEEISNHETEVPAE